MTRWLLCLFGAGALAGAGFWGVHHYHTSREAPTAPPVDPVREAVVALGRLQPISEVVDVGGAQGRLVNRLLVKEGQWVQAGDPLVYLDNYAELLANVQYAESQLKGARGQLTAREAAERANIAKAEFDIQDMQTEDPLRFSTERLKVRQMRRDMADAEREAERLRRLSREGAVSGKSLDEQVAKVQQRRNDLAIEEQTLTRMQSELPTNMKKARQDLAVAKANLELARWNIDPATLARNLDLSRARLEGSIIRAPTQGEVLRIRTRPGEVLRDQTVLQLGDTSAMSAEADVYESDVLLVKVGQKATVTAPALPGPLTGRVVSIGQLVAKQTVTDLNPSAASDARVVTVRVRLDRPEPANRLINLQVTVTIHLGADSPAPGPS